MRRDSAVVTAQKPSGLGTKSIASGPVLELNDAGSEEYLESDQLSDVGLPAVNFTPEKQETRHEISDC